MFIRLRGGILGTFSVNYTRGRRGGDESIPLCGSAGGFLGTREGRGFSGAYPSDET
jgi:hypothetical protein